MMLLALLLAQTLPPASDAPLAPVRPIASLPTDVRRFIARYDECQHWLGEEPYDDARRRQIDAATAKTCKGIDAAGAKLRKRYAANAGVSAALVAYPPLDISYK